MGKQPHAIKRARERLGLEITGETLSRWRETILAGKATLIRRESPVIAIWRLEHDGVKFRVVFHEEAKKIMTVMEAKPPRSVQPNTWTKAERRRQSIKRYRGH